MVECLTYAAFKAVRIRVELNSKAMKKLAAPKIFFGRPTRCCIFWCVCLIFANISWFQDPAKPKPKKRTERAEDKVARTVRALAKARVEKESTKKAKSDILVEVNSPRVSSKAGETDIFFPLFRLPPSEEFGLHSTISFSCSAGGRSVCRGRTCPFHRVEKGTKIKGWMKPSRSFAQRQTSSTAHGST